MKANYNRGHKIPKVLSGDGAEWSDVSKGVEQSFLDWLSHSEITETEFADMLMGKSFVIKEMNIEDYGVTVKAIAICSENGFIGAPFLYKESTDYPYTEFKTDVLLLLFYISGRYLSSELESAIRDFAVGTIH